jgi:hypothetical protein
MNNACTRCMVLERLPGQKWCRPCMSSYQRERRAKLRGGGRLALVADNGGGGREPSLTGIVEHLTACLASEHIGLQEATKLRILAQAARELAVAGRLAFELERTQRALSSLRFPIPTPL